MRNFKLEIKLDLHTHTNVSDHAYSTLMENVNAAAERGLEAIAMTNHGPFIEDSAHDWHYRNFKCIPRVVKNIVVFTGVELSYIDADAQVDMPENLLKQMDIVIGSMHGGDFIHSEEEYVNLMVKASKNPDIDILGHIARTKYELSDKGCDIIAVEAKKNNKLVELNNSCIAKGVEVFFKNSKALMLACKRNNTPIVVNTDAHFCTLVGDVEKAVKLLEEIDFEENLVMNTNLDRFMDYIGKKKNIDMLRG